MFRILELSSENHHWVEEQPETYRHGREGPLSPTIHQGGSNSLLQKSGPQTSSISSVWELVRKAECQAWFLLITRCFPCTWTFKKYCSNRRGLSSWKDSDDSSIETLSISQADTSVNLARGSVENLPKAKVYLPLNSLKFSSNVDGVQNVLGVSC